MAVAVPSLTSDPSNIQRRQERVTSDTFPKSQEELSQKPPANLLSLLSGSHRVPGPLPNQSPVRAWLSSKPANPVSV